VRLVIQRVSRAAVRVRGETVAEIGPGLLVLVGVSRDEQEEEAVRLAGKVATLRIFEDDRGKMNLSLRETDGEILAVPQFTLYADANRGRRPSWDAAAGAQAARGQVDAFAQALEALGVRVRRGSFQEHMEVELVNDGPVTILLDGRAPGSASLKRGVEGPMLEA
jgi:D-tyrosyl-tRNA(Tyr) deacylase